MAAVAAALGGNNFSAPSMDPFEVLRSDFDPNKPAPPPAQIRPFRTETDLKVGRYIVGASVMEPSSLANQAALFQPLILIFWAIFTHYLVTRVGRGWPTTIYHLLGLTVPASRSGQANDALQIFTDFLAMSPLLVTPPIVLLAIFELRHRNLFEDEMTRTIGEEDMREIEGYYKVDQIAHPEKDGDRSGFWVLEYDGRIIGAAGLDGRKPGQHLDSVVDLIANKKQEDEATSNKDDSPATATSTAASSTTRTLRSRNKLSANTEADETTPSLSLTPPTPSSGTSSTSVPFTTSPLPLGTLHLRRFATSMSFRSADIEDDLLTHISSFAFSSSTTQQIVIAVRPAVQKSLVKRLKKNGWELTSKGGELEVPIVGKGDGKNVENVGTFEKVARVVWPLNLESRTFVLTRKAWEKMQKKD